MKYLDLIPYSHCPIGIRNQLRHLQEKEKALLLQSIGAWGGVVVKALRY